MNIEKTKAYYEQICNSDLCGCEYCQNYVREIKAAYPEVADYLLSLGIDIEKPFETLPLEPDNDGYIEYTSVQYVVFGKPDDFVKTTVGSVNLNVTDTHPSTQIDEAHFVIAIYPVRLKWVMQTTSD